MPAAGERCQAVTYSVPLDAVSYALALTSYLLSAGSIALALANREGLALALWLVAGSMALASLYPLSVYVNLLALVLGRSTPVRQYLGAPLSLSAVLVAPMALGLVASLRVAALADVQAGSEWQRCLEERRKQSFRQIHSQLLSLRVALVPPAALATGWRLVKEIACAVAACSRLSTELLRDEAGLGYLVDVVVWGNGPCPAPDVKAHSE